MEKITKKVYIAIGAVAVGLCLIVCYFFDNKNEVQNYNYLEVENVSQDLENEEDIEDNKKIIVHIAGEVKNPGVFEVEEGARISNIIELAGGITDIANMNNVNLAYKVGDGQKIYIPSTYDLDCQNEILSISGGNNVIVDGGNFNNNAKININTATQTELESLSGIGPSIAAKIIKYRSDNGKFKNIEEIKNVSGVGEEKYRYIEDEICV